MPKHVQFLPVFLPLAVLHLACSDDPKPQTIKTEIYSPLLAGFCEDEAHVKSPESEFTSCASGHWGENEFFVRFNEPRADFPWLASVSPDPGNGKLTMEDVAVLQDANDVLLEGFGVSLAELDRAVVPTVLEVPGVEGKIFHSYVEHFNHRVDERRVKGDKIFISRSPTGSVR